MAKVKNEKQLQLFNSFNCMVVDPAVEHLEAMLAPRIDEATTMHRYGAISPATVYKHLDSGASSSGQYEHWNLCGVEAVVTPKRLQSFRHSMKCVGCGIEGNVFLVEKHNNDRVAQYLNLYAIMPTKHGSEMILITVDHILPDSMGGRYGLTNFQTMCRKCNVNKGNRMSPEEIALVRASPHTYVKSWMPKPYLMLLLDLQELMNNAPDKHVANVYQKVSDIFRKKIKSTTTDHHIDERTVALQKAIKDAVDKVNGVELTVVPVKPPRTPINVIVKRYMAKVTLHLSNQFLTYHKRLA